MTFHAEPFVPTADTSAAIHHLASGHQAGAQPSRLRGAPHDEELGCPTRRLLSLSHRLPHRLTDDMRGPMPASRPCGSLAAEDP